MSASHEETWIDSNGHVIVVGDIDVVSAPAIESAIRQAEARVHQGRPPVVVDVKAVGFIDSSGLRVLLAASRRNDGAGRRVVLRSPGTVVRRLLDITGTAVMFDQDPLELS